MIITNQGSEQEKLIRLLIGITIVIVLLNVINVVLGRPSWQITRLIDVGIEANFPTWISSLLLAIAAYFAYQCSSIAKTKQIGQRMWQLFSLCLIGMSCDETAQIHELMGRLLKKYLIKSTSIEHSTWVVILGPFILLIIFSLILKIKKYLRGSRKAIIFLITGLSAYVFGAFILESTINLLNHEDLEWIWRIENILEESCEMFGVIIIIKGLIEHYKFLLQREVSVIENNIRTVS